MRRGLAILMTIVFVPFWEVCAEQTTVNTESHSVEKEAIQENDSAIEELSQLIAEQWEEDYFAEMVVPEEVFEEYFEKDADGYYETERIGSGKVQVTAPFQTRRLIVTGVQLRNTYDATDVIDLSEYDMTILQYDTEEQTMDAYDKITAIYGEESCQPDRVYNSKQLLLETTESGDYQCTSWGATLMGMEHLKNQTEYQFDGEEPHTISNTVTIAVIDTGIYKDSNFFSGRTITSSSRTFLKATVDGKETVEQIEDVSDTSTVTKGHGTHVAGIIADSTPDNVELMILKVFDENGVGPFSAILAAMIYAIENNADVMNMSLGFSGLAEEDMSDFIPMDKVIDQAYAKGIPICAAAGNENADTATCYPACNDKVISVGAINESEERWISNWKTGSNYGKGLDFCAPGVDILSAYYISESGTIRKTGTSMATPHIASEVAYVKLLFPDATVSQVESILKSYCKDLGDAGWDDFFGWGYPDITKLYQMGDQMVYKINDKDSEPDSIIQEEEPLEIIDPGNTNQITTSTEPTVIQKVAKVKSFKVKRKSSGTVKLQWKKNSQASGYQIQYSLKKNFKTKKTIRIKKSGKTSYVLKKLKKGRSYYFRIRAYKTVNGKNIYSSWSSRQKIKIK